MAGALAEYMMYGSAPRPAASIDAETKRIGEEMVIEKINKIFDEAQKENKEFEDSYQSLKKPQSFIDTSMQANDQSIDYVSPGKKQKKVTIVEDGGQPQRPSLVPQP